MEKEYPKISVIVPVYNVEQYLPRCIDSILSQTFTDFELLLIDDGSTDGSDRICDEYEKQDRRIRVFHKENGGVSSARNLGLANSCGEHIVFIDSDDWIGRTHLEELIKFKDNDIVIGGKTFVGDYRGADKFEDNRIYLGDDIGKVLKATLTDNKLRVPWAKLYKKSIIEENNLLFNLHMKIAEDTVFVQQYLCHCKSICLINAISYFYYLKKGFIKYQLTESELLYSLKTTISVYDALSQKFSLKDDMYINFIKCYFIRLYFNYVNSCRFSLKEYRKMRTCLTQIKIDDLKCQSHAFRHKIMYCILKNKLFILLFLYLKITSIINKIRSLSCVNNISK